MFTHLFSLAADNDRIRQERLKKGGRPQTSHSVSQATSRSSCSSALVRKSDALKACVC